MNKHTPKFVAACALFMGAKATFAHDGHGMAGTHWHATDAWGFVAVTALVVMAIWLSKK